MTTLAPGAVEPVEAFWWLNGVSQTGSATVTFRTFPGGVENYWTGTAWTTTVTTLAMSAITNGYRYLLTTPALWLGSTVQVTCSLPGMPDLTDEITVDATVSSRAQPSDLVINDNDVITAAPVYSGRLT